MSNLFDTWNANPSSSNDNSSPKKDTIQGVAPIDNLEEETICEGYVTKKGHLVKNWLRRYLVFEGKMKTCSYYDSKTLYQNSSPPKGHFIVSSIEKYEYNIGVVGTEIRPYGFKLIGHSPGHGYFELFAFVESAVDLARWYRIVSRAISQDRNLQITTQSPSSKGHSLSPTKLFSWFTSNKTNTQALPESPKIHLDPKVIKVQENTQNILQHAIQDAEKSRQLANATCNELGQQEEIMNNIEVHLDNIDSDISRGHQILDEMKNPMTAFLFSHKAKTPQDVEQSPTTIIDKTKGKNKSHPSTQVLDGNDELAKLSNILQDLHVQAESIGKEVDRSNEQLARIEVKMEEVNIKLKDQTKTADDIANKGTVW